jgi:ABC-type lipoprotein release transport system permease subunit
LQSGEIALGARLMRKLHKEIGDTVTVSGSPDGGVPFQIVGVTVSDLTPRAPEIEPGDAALVTLESVRLLEPTVTSSGFAVQFMAGVPVNGALDRLEASFPNTLTVPEPPPDLVNLHRIDLLPALLALLIVVFALGTLAHTMLVSIRRRRREFAVLKSLGYVRNQVSATVAWQATVSAVTAALIGIPLGIAVGRGLWIFVADEVGVRSDPSIPLWPLVAIAVATVLAGNLVAAAPAWAAARGRPAPALRTE